MIAAVVTEPRTGEFDATLDNDPGSLANYDYRWNVERTKTLKSMVSRASPPLGFTLINKLYKIFLTGTARGGGGGGLPPLSP